jgi:hypothetical protein
MSGQPRTKLEGRLEHVDQGRCSHACEGQPHPHAYGDGGQSQAAHIVQCVAILQVAVTQQMQSRVGCPHATLVGCHWRAFNDNRQFGLVLCVSPANQPQVALLLPSIFWKRRSRWDIANKGKQSGSRFHPLFLCFCHQPGKTVSGSRHVQVNMEKSQAAEAKEPRLILPPVPCWRSHEPPVFYGKARNMRLNNRPRPRSVSPRPPGSFYAASFISVEFPFLTFRAVFSRFRCLPSGRAASHTPILLTCPPVEHVPAQPDLR